LNGDVISDIDYGRLIEFHKRKGGLATIALIRVPDPSRYGAVELDSEDKVLRFVEKPVFGTAPSNLINAGIYVMEKEVLDYIPDGKVSTETEIFPQLAKEGKLYGYEGRGLWVDIGVPDSYLEANHLVLDKLNGSAVGEGCQVDETAKIMEPSSLGNGVLIGANSVIGPDTSISDHVQIGQGCRIERSIIFPGVTIGDYSSIRGR